MKAKKLKKGITIDNLAAMVQKGFLEMREYMGKKFKIVEEKIDNIEKDTKELKEGQEDIKVGLKQRVHIFDHKSLEFRVDRLEEKVGITRRR